jgi:hypothetical protein
MSSMAWSAATVDQVSRARDAMLQYCKNLDGKFADLLAKLKTHGLIASA